MRKHLFGLAIFISIVTAAVFVYGYFNTPPIPVIPAVDYPSEQHETVVTEDFDTSLIGYRVYASEFHIGTGKFQTRVDLEWKGVTHPPKSVFMNFHLIDGNRTHQSSVSKSMNDPFLTGSRQTVTVETSSFGQSLFNQGGNIYTYVEFSTDRQFSSKTEERLKLADLTSVVMVHPTKSEPSELRNPDHLQ
jgi:hypothetical protein